MTTLFTSTAHYLRRCHLLRIAVRNCSVRAFSADSNEKNDGKMYFHVSPSGDWWTGPSIFAAKHLQPDYVKSIRIPKDFDPTKYFSEDEGVENENDLSWEEKQLLLHQIYDQGKFPSHLLPPIPSKENDNGGS